MIGCLPTQALAFLAVFIYATHATHATQAIAFGWKLGFTPEPNNTLTQQDRAKQYSSLTNTTH